MVTFTKQFDADFNTKWDDDDNLKSMTIKVKFFPKDFPVANDKALAMDLQDALHQVFKKHHREQKTQ